MTGNPVDNAKVKNEGQSCWMKCGRKSGNCSWCGDQGMCCRHGSNWIENGCNGEIGGPNGHTCTAKPNPGKSLYFQYLMI